MNDAGSKASRGPSVVPLSLFVGKECDEIEEIERQWRRSGGSIRTILERLCLQAGETGDSSYVDILPCFSDNAMRDQATAQLQKKVAENHGEVVTGLFFLSLVEPNRDVAGGVARDGLSLLMTLVKRLVMEKFHKLRFACKKEVLRIVDELIKLNTGEVSLVMQFILRNARGGDISEQNIWLVDEIMTCVWTRNREWFYSQVDLIPLIVYSYVSLIADHNKNHLHELRNREVSMCCQILRERFNDCLVLGRDLVRVLQNISKIPDMATLWTDMLKNPNEFSAKGTINTLLGLRTPRKIFVCRIPPLMEQQILFVLKRVQMGNQIRYQQWFHMRYLNEPENESCICDLFRYIICVYHPSNEVLGSSIVPRWAILGWLLKCVKSPPILANVKQALFYDWMFFNPATDNIMNIEPAMLLMMHSLPKYPAITGMLLEFLLLLIDHFDPRSPDGVRRGVRNAFLFILKRKVVGSLDPILSSPHIDPSVRTRVKGLLSDIGGQPAPSAAQSSPRSPAPDTVPQQRQASCGNVQKRPASSGTLGVSSSNGNFPRAKRARMGGKDGSEPGREKKQRRTVIDDDDMMLDTPYSAPPGTGRVSTASIRSEKTMDQCFSTLSQYGMSLTSSSGHDPLPLAVAAALQRLVTIVNEDETDKSLTRIGPFLCDLIQRELGVRADAGCSELGRVAPSPLIDALCGLFFEDFDKSSTQDLFSHLRKNEPTFGFRAVSYMVFHRLLESNGENGMLAHDMITNCNNTESLERDYPAKQLPLDDCLQSFFVLSGGSEEECLPLLLSDLELCSKLDPTLFFDLFRIISNDITPILNESPELIERWVGMTVRALDPTNLPVVYAQIAAGEGMLVGGAGLEHVVSKSLLWPSYDQMLFWDLLLAEYSFSSADEVVPMLIRQIDPRKDSEATLGLLKLLREVKRSMPKTFRCLMTSSIVQSHSLPADVFQGWIERCSEATLSLLQSFLHASLTGEVDLEERRNFMSNMFVWWKRFPAARDIIDGVKDSLSKMYHMLGAGAQDERHKVLFESKSA